MVKLDFIVQVNFVVLLVDLVALRISRIMEHHQQVPSNLNEHLYEVHLVHAYY